MTLPRVTPPPPPAPATHHPVPTQVPPPHWAWVDGERDQLWWEFRLGDSFRWQAHVYGLDPATFRSRLRRLARGFDLAHRLRRRVADLTAAERARADLAAALLAQPAVLVWRHPCARLAVAERFRLWAAVRRWQRVEGLRVQVVGTRGRGRRR